jgi:anaerobic ribonucleoside-triphosphate reductase activating protein
MVQIRIAGITKDSVVDGPGLRLTIFTQGCPHHCLDCHNPDTHNLYGGSLLEVRELLGIIDQSKLIRGVTFSGGEPFLQAEPIAHLAQKVKSQGLDIVTYSGFLFEQLLSMAEKNKDVGKLLYMTDILVDGPYQTEKRDLRLAFRGSSNQRLIDVPSSIKLGKIVLWEK